jgi:hypothetical protein
VVDSPLKREVSRSGQTIRPARYRSGICEVEI